MTNIFAMSTFTFSRNGDFLPLTTIFGSASIEEAKNDEQNHCPYFDQLEEHEEEQASFIFCPDCNQKSCYGTFIDTEETLFHYLCKNCNSYYATCVTCYKNGKRVVCQLLSHHNHNCYCDPLHATYKVVQIQEHDNDDYSNDTEIEYNISTWKYDQNRFGDITGPDGGYFSRWKCQCCDGTYRITDK